VERPSRWSVQLGSGSCQIRCKIGYHDTEQSQANQSDRFSFSSLQAGGHRFDPGHVHQNPAGVRRDFEALEKRRFQAIQMTGITAFGLADARTRRPCCDRLTAVPATVSTAVRTDVHPNKGRLTASQSLGKRPGRLPIPLVGKHPKSHFAPISFSGPCRNARRGTVLHQCVVSLDPGRRAQT
jgi:hypothetical protein